ncbi:MAG TPA: hypothetical protein VHE34_09630 [Puia sp.]|uniref:hypothetical protein n=1 Tax=Puia sp. TaxID=2045100 RepID=UPI002BF52A89|nr:hypothetical protein [Puia sp.]HVU95475.1 hypothetical protein [Puia sp.]
MKRLSTALGALVFLLALTAMSFTAKHTPSSRSTITSSKPAAKKARDVAYYFYDLNDNYVDHATAADEEYRLENIYFVLVDQNPSGGDNLEYGYVMPGKPHTGFVDCFLYGHFGSLAYSNAKVAHR